MKSRLVLSSLFFLAVVMTISLLIPGDSIAIETTAQLPLSCYDSVTLTSRPVNPDEGCAISDDVIECPVSAPNVYFGHKDYVQGNLVIKDNIQTMLCLPDNAPELIDPVKCKKPNGSTYYAKLLCGAYAGPNNTIIYPEAIQCQKDYTLQNGGCSQWSSPTPSPSPAPSPGSMPRCDWNTQHVRESDFTCQSNSNCTDTANPEYNTPICLAVRAANPFLSPAPAPAIQCPKKPDPAKGTAEPTGIPEGFEALAVSETYYFWGCYSTPDRTSSCNPQKTSRTGTLRSPCIYGEESIVCNKKDTAYREGNNLKCAPTKKIEATIAPPVIVVTETIREREIVTVEVTSPITIQLPSEATEENCKTYKDQMNEQVIAQGNALITAADERIKAAAVKDPEFKKTFYKTLKDAAQDSRKFDNLVKDSPCNFRALEQINSEAKVFEAGNLEKIREGLVFIDQDSKMQNQYAGIQKDLKMLEKFEQIIKRDPKKEKLYTDRLQELYQVQADFDEIIKAGKEGKVFGFEIANAAEQIENLRKDFEKEPSSTVEQKTKIEKKSSKALKKTLKKSAKKTKKKSKKSSKKKK